MVTNLVPAGAVVWGWYDGEVVTQRQLIALAVILPMAALVQFGGRREIVFNVDEPLIDSKIQDAK